jgi:hypothetical protein
MSFEPKQDGSLPMRVSLLVLSILTGYVVDTSAQSTTVAVPAALSEALTEYGCVHIADDAEVLRNRDRWWVSLKPITGGDADFAFYCQSTADQLMSRLVVGGWSLHPEIPRLPTARLA